MRDVIEDDDGQRLGVPSLFAMIVAAVIGVGVSYNALLAQPGAPQRIAEQRQDASSGHARIDVEAPRGDANTITLSYDPEIEALQRQLLAAGFYKGDVDGVAGKRTRTAIAAFQTQAGLPVTGDYSPELSDQLRFTTEVLRAAEYTGATSAPQEPPGNPKDILLVQTGLAELGYSPGDINGEMSAATEEAIKTFERDRRMPETGRMSQVLLDELSKVSGQSAIAPQN